MGYEKILSSSIGQTCGGVGYIVGRCGKGLKCNLAYATFKNPVGYCVPLLMPTAAPVQLGHLTKVPFLGVGSQEAKNFDQQSAVTRKNIPGVPRQNIPGVPSRKTEENTIKKEQTSSEYFVHASDLWSMDSVKILNDTAQSHPDMLAKNLTQNSTHTDDQRRQKLADKGTACTVTYSAGPVQLQFCNAHPNFPWSTPVTLAFNIVEFLRRAVEDKERHKLFRG